MSSAIQRIETPIKGMAMSNHPQIGILISQEFGCTISLFLFEPPQTTAKTVKNNLSRPKMNIFYTYHHEELLQP